MLFNSYPFIFLFLPIVFAGYHLSSRYCSQQVARLFLLLSSLGFYGFWDYRFVPLLLLSICANYLFGIQILRSSTTSRKAWLAAGITLNLAALFYFKYALFAMSIAETVLGWSIELPAGELPLGISFFTFTQIAFLVDAYSDKVASLTPSSYGLFVTVFPHLIAGPILHHKAMMSQFEEKETYRFLPENIAKGLALFIMGLGKKVLIADTIAPWFARIFDQPQLYPNLFDAWGAILGYTLQLYYDFSGYSDMAIGLGLLFNLQLPINFNSPYKAQSISDFWRRWHISLSRFLRDYLYIPLGGSRSGKMATLVNLFLTMLLGGIWHGAGWTFVIWGALQGAYLVINHICRNYVQLPSAIAWPLTLLAVMVGWVVFRAPDMGKAGEIYAGMVGLNGLGRLSVLSGGQFATLLILLAATLTLPNSNELLEKFQPKKRYAVCLGALMAVCVLFFDRISEFLYYQF